MFCLIALCLSMLYLAALLICTCSILVAVNVTYFIPLGGCAWSADCLSLLLLQEWTVYLIRLNWIDGQLHRKHIMPLAGSSVLCRVPESLMMLDMPNRHHHAVLSTGLNGRALHFKQEHDGAKGKNGWSQKYGNWCLGKDLLMRPVVRRGSDSLILTANRWC